MSDYGEATQSEWNGGTLTNVRLHNIRMQMFLAMHNKDLPALLNAIKEENHELYGFQDDKTRIRLRNMITKLSDDINTYLLYKYDKRIKDKSIPAKLFHDIDDIRYELDAAFNKSGLQTAMKEEEMF